jgi:hypothetical protein
LLAEPPSVPKRVPLLESFSRDFSPYNYISSIVRANLTRLQVAPIEFLHVSLEADGVPPLDEAALVG